MEKIKKQTINFDTDFFKTPQLKKSVIYDDNNLKKNPRKTSRINKYDNYKDSDINWLGEIPAHWKLEKGKWLFKKEERLPKEGDEIVTCFRDGTVTLRKNRRVDGFTNALKEHGYQGVQKGDLVIHAMDAFAGAIGVSDSNGKSTPVYSVCTPITENFINQYYYAYLLRNLALTGFIRSLAKGIRERSTDFRYNDFSILIFPLPPLHEQQTIAKFLDEKCEMIDKAVAQKEKLIELLKERKQIIIQNAVTKGIDPNVKMKDSGVDWIGEIPEHWEVKRLKRLSRIKRGASPRPIDDPKYFDEEGEYSWVRIADVSASNHYLKTTTQRLSNLGSSLSVKILPGNIFLSIAGSVGKPIISRIKCCIHDGFVYFPDLYEDQEFLYYIFSSSQIYSGLGKIGTQLNLNTDTVANILIPQPPIYDQQAIVDHIEKESAKIDKAIKIQQKQIEKLKEYKEVLIDNAVTGKIRVVDYEK